MLDMPTIIVATCCTAVVQGLLLLFFWFREGRSPAMAMSGAAFIFFGVGFALMGAHQLIPIAGAIGIGGGSVALSGALFVSASRRFGRRRPLMFLVVATPLLWAVGYLYSPFMQTAAARASILSIFMAICFFACAFECARWTVGGRMAKRLLVGATIAFGCLFILRALFNAELPFPLGSQPHGDSIWFSLMSFGVFILLSMVAFIAVGMTHHWAETERELQAVVDPVTGALRRGAFILQGGRMVARHHEDGRSACLALITLASPPAVVSDDALRLFARAASSSLKPTDLMARMSIDVFACILSDVMIGEAVDIVQALAGRTEAAANAAGFVLLARAGITSSTQNGADLRSMLQAADHALGSARFAGDSVVAYHPALEPGRSSPIIKGGMASL